MVIWVAIFLFLIGFTFASTSYVIDLKYKISLTFEENNIFEENLHNSAELP